MIQLGQFFIPFGDDGFICFGVLALLVFLGTTITRTSRRCPNCTERNRPQAVFCAHCGQRLPGK